MRRENGVPFRTARVASMPSDTGFHVEDARPRQPAVRARAAACAIEMTDRQAGIEVAESRGSAMRHGRLSRAQSREFGQQMIAAILSGEPCDAAPPIAP